MRQINISYGLSRALILARLARSRNSCACGLVFSKVGSLEAVGITIVAIAVAMGLFWPCMLHWCVSVGISSLLFLRD